MDKKREEFEKQLEDMEWEMPDSFKKNMEMIDRIEAPFRDITNLSILSNIRDLDAQLKETIVSIRLPFDEMNKIISGFNDINSNIVEQFESIITDIDFSRLSEVGKVHALHTMELLKEGWSLGWYIGEELLVTLLDEYESLTEEYHFNEAVVKSYLENNFEVFVDKAISHPFYQNHKILLEEAKSLYLEEKYAIACFPLFSAIDNLFTRWITTPHNLLVDSNTRFINWSLKEKLNTEKEKYNPSSTFTSMHTNIYSAYRGYLHYFESSKNRKSVNRNIYMHGNYDYELMDKWGCLKLWSMLILCIDGIEDMQKK